MPRKTQPVDPNALKVMVIHGPNLNLLGLRDPEHYGTLTLDKLNRALRREARTLNLELRIVQTNHEGRIIDLLQKRRKWAAAFLLNPGAFTHYSYAIRDAIEAIKTPVVEVHLSNIHAREDFRRLSVVEEVCLKSFFGKQVDSYLEALTFLAKYLGSGS